MRLPFSVFCGAVVASSFAISLLLAVPAIAGPTLSEESVYGFNVYLQQGAVEGQDTPHGAGVDGPYGDFVRYISFDDPLAHITKLGSSLRVEVDDSPYGMLGDADMCAFLYTGTHSTIQPIPGVGAQTASVMYRYIFDFVVNGQVAVSRWQLHYGETIPLPPVGPLISVATATPRINTTTAVPVSGKMPTATVDFTLGHAHVVSPETATISFGDMGSEDLPFPLPATVSHTYTISGKSVTRDATVSIGSPIDNAWVSVPVTILLQPGVKLRVNGQKLPEGNTCEVEAGLLLDLSLATSTGYIEQGSFLIADRLNKSGAGLSYSGILFDDSDIGRTYPLTVGVSNTGAGINSDSMTVNLVVVPEPATLGLLGLAACGLLRRVRPGS